jgi:hypothetical protein
MSAEKGHDSRAVRARRSEAPRTVRRTWLAYSLPRAVGRVRTRYHTTLTLRDQYGPVKRSWRLAVAMIGHVQWELIEPLDDESIYARFLAERGGGVHHIAVVAPNFDETLGMEAKRGNDVVLSGVFSGIQVVYLATERYRGADRDFQR